MFFKQKLRIYIRFSLTILVRLSEYWKAFFVFSIRISFLIIFQKCSWSLLVNTVYKRFIFRKLYNFKIFNNVGDFFFFLELLLFLIQCCTRKQQIGIRLPPFAPNLFYYRTLEYHNLIFYP